jgi:hypothetical protein
MISVHIYIFLLYISPFSPPYGYLLSLSPHEAAKFSFQNNKSTLQDTSCLFQLLSLNPCTIILSGTFAETCPVHGVVMLFIPVLCTS